MDARKAEPPVFFGAAPIAALLCIHFGAPNRGVAALCIYEYALCMRRITVSLDEDLARLAEAEVRAGRAPSVSAWIADAIRAKARARADLVADFEDLERREPSPPEVVASIARALGLTRAGVLKAIKGRRGRPGVGRAA